MLTSEFPVKTALLAGCITVIASLFNDVGLLTISARLMAAFISFYIIGTFIRILMEFELKGKSSASFEPDEAEDKIESEDEDFIEYNPPVMQATEKRYPGRR